MNRDTEDKSASLINVPAQLTGLRYAETPADPTNQRQLPAWLPVANVANQQHVTLDAVRAAAVILVGVVIITVPPGLALSVGQRVVQRLFGWATLP